jgi:Family of unknown function (DUF6510)/Thioredoxin
VGPIVQELTPPVDPDRDHWRGGEHAPVTLVEYGDYECPYSRLAFGAIQRLGAELDERLRFAFRHLPLTAIHPHALVAAHDRVVPADEVSEDLVGGARCPNCDQVLLRLVHGPDRAWLDLRGLDYLHFPWRRRPNAGQRPRWPG